MHDRNLEHLIDVLMGMQRSLGREAYRRACDRARHAVAATALQIAEERAGQRREARRISRLINHQRTK